MAVELRRWSRVNEQEAQEERAEACYIALSQCPNWPNCPRESWASEGVRLQYRGSCRWCPRPAVRLLAPTGPGAHACPRLPRQARAGPGCWQMRCASRGLAGLDGIDNKPVAPDPRCQCQSVWGRIPPDVRPRPCRSPPGACPTAPPGVRANPAGCYTAGQDKPTCTALSCACATATPTRSQEIPR